MDTWRNVILQNFPEFDHHPKSWELSDASAQIGALLWHAAVAHDAATLQRLIKFLAWAEEQGTREEGLAWLAEDALRRTISAAPTRAAFIAQLNARTLRSLARAIGYLTSSEILADAERAVQTRESAADGSTVGG